MTGHARRGTMEGEGDAKPWRDHDRAFAVLAACIAALLLTSATAIAAGRLAGIADDPWVALFSVNSERNIPTWFSIVLLAAGAGLAWAAGQRESARRGPGAAAWRWLAVVLALLSLDECAGLHEAVGRALVGAVELGGLLHFRWVAVGAPAALATVLVLGWLGRGLPRGDRARLAVVAAVYFGGAVVLEAVGGVMAENYGRRSLAALAAIHAEEGMEMLGAALMVRALLASRQEDRAAPRPA